LELHPVFIVSSYPAGIVRIHKRSKSNSSKEIQMKKIIGIILATIAIAATALIAVPAFAKGEPPKVQTIAQATIATPIATTVTPATTSINPFYMEYSAAFCGGGLVMNDTVTLQRVATTLGITYDQLVTDLQNGQTIAFIATAQKVDLSKVIDTVVAAQTDMVNVLVKYGYINQDQANAIIANLRTRVESVLSATTPAGTSGYGFGMMGSGTISPVTPVTFVTGYGYGMMGGTGRGMMGW
jgi:hypothetical protein